MRIYIASHSQSRASELKRVLEGHGHVIVARWIDCDTKFGLGVSAYSDDERRALAVMDDEDVRRADALVLLAEPEGQTVPGGKHVETGIAIALGRLVFVLGRRENLFHWHPAVTPVSSVKSLLLELRKRPLGGAQELQHSMKGACAECQARSALHDKAHPDLDL